MSTLSPRALALRCHLERYLAKESGQVKLRVPKIQAKFHKSLMGPKGAEPSAELVREVRESWAAAVVASPKPVRISTMTHTARLSNSEIKDLAVYAAPSSCADASCGPAWPYLGMHSLVGEFNFEDHERAALYVPVEDLLTSRPLVEFSGETTRVIDLARCADPDWVAAVCDEESTARGVCRWLQSCMAMSGPPVLDRRAKQILFMAGAEQTLDDDAPETVQMVLLANAALSHRVWQIDAATRSWRLGPKSSPALSEVTYRLATTLVGGAHPENVTALARVRSGKNFGLLALPPQVREVANDRIGRSTCGIKVFLAGRRVRELMDIAARRLIALHAKPGDARARAAVQKHAVALVRLFQEFVDEVRTGDLGMFTEHACRLPTSQRLVLSGQAPSAEAASTAAQDVGRRFAQLALAELRRRDAIAGEGYDALLTEVMAAELDLCPEIKEPQ